MAVFYLDSSALVKRYTQEAGTVWVQNITDNSAGNGIFAVSLTGPEMLATFFRKARGGNLPRAEALRLASALGWIGNSIILS